MDIALEMPRLGGGTTAAKPLKRKANAVRAHPPPGCWFSHGRRGAGVVFRVRFGAGTHAGRSVPLRLAEAMMHPQQLLVLARSICDGGDGSPRTACTTTATAATVPAATESAATATSAAAAAAATDSDGSSSGGRKV